MSDTERLPWFRFWADDYRGSSKVQRMSWAERGVYMHLLTYAWKRGGRIPNEPEELADALCCSPEEASELVTPLIRRCFEEIEGNLVNAKLAEQAAEADGKREQAREAGRASAAKRKRSAGATVVERALNGRSVPVERTFNHSESESDPEPNTPPSPPPGAKSPDGDGARGAPLVESEADPPPKPRRRPRIDGPAELEHALEAIGADLGRPPSAELAAAAEAYRALRVERRWPPWTAERSWIPSWRRAEGSEPAFVDALRKSVESGWQSVNPKPPSAARPRRGPSKYPETLPAHDPTDTDELVFDPWGKDAPSKRVG